MQLRDLPVNDSGEMLFDTKAANQLYWNTTGLSTCTIKAHNHATTSGINVELKSETVATSGTHYGLYNEAHLSASGTTNIFGNYGVAVVESGKTATSSTVIGSYGQARADGTSAGSGFYAGLYGLIEAGAAMTASHVCSAWLDSHQAAAVTGSHQLLYMTNNGAATMDEAIYIYGGDKISKLMELNTVSGMVGSSNGSGADVYIDFTINGVAARLTAKYVA